MVRARGVTGGRPDAPVAFPDKILDRELLRAAEAAGLTRPLVHQLRQRLRQSVAQRLREDRAIIVVRGPKLRRERLDAVARGHGEAADVVDPAAVPWRHIIC